MITSVLSNEKKLCIHSRGGTGGRLFVELNGCGLKNFIDLCCRTDVGSELVIRRNLDGFC